MKHARYGRLILWLRWCSGPQTLDSPGACICASSPDRYFFYLTNDLTTPASEVVFLANDRCAQENLIAQSKGGVKALSMPVGDLVSNGAYMVMASLAWSRKAWAALLLTVQGRWAVKCGAEERSL